MKRPHVSVAEMSALGSFLFHANDGLGSSYLAFEVDRLALAPKLTRANVIADWLNTIIFLEKYDNLLCTKYAVIYLWNKIRTKKRQVLNHSFVGR